MQPSDYPRITIVSDPRLSPDGRTVAFVATSADTEADRMAPAIWVAPADGSAPPRPFTIGDRASSPRFSPDGGWLAFVRATSAGFVLCAAPLDGGEARVLAGPFSLLSSPAWSPTSDRLAFAARIGQAPTAGAPRVVSHLANRQDGQGWWTGPSHVHVVGLDGAAAVAITGGTADHDQPAWSPDGRTIALVADREPGHEDRMYHGDVWLADVEAWERDGGEAPLTRLSAGSGVAYEPVFSPDGTELAYLGNDAGDALWWTPVEVRVATIATGAVRSLTSAWDGSAGSRGAVEGRQLEWTLDGSAICFTAPARGAFAIHRVGTSGGEVTRLTDGVRHTAGFALDGPGRIVFCERSFDALPTLAAIDLASAHETVLADPNEEVVASLDLRPIESFTHVASDGMEIESFFIRPAGDGPFPLFLDIHGGPHGAHPTASPRMVTLCKAAVARGFAVLLPNPRGSAGYGAKLLESVVGDWGGDDMDDILGAVDHLIAEGVVDAGRLHLHGYSYGGYASSWLIGHTDRFRSASIGAPVGDLFSMALTTDITGFSTSEAGGDPWDDFERYRDRSPSAHLAKASTPSFVYASEGDLRCPIDQALQVFTALRLAGVECTLARYPGGSHGVATPSQVVDQIERVLAHVEAHA